MNYILKQEYVGYILEINSYQYSNKIFDTNIIDPSEYKTYFDKGFNWAFDITID